MFDLQVWYHVELLLHAWSRWYVRFNQQINLWVEGKSIYSAKVLNRPISSWFVHISCKLDCRWVFFEVASGGFLHLRFFQLQMGMQLRKMLPLSPEIIFGWKWEYAMVWTCTKISWKYCAHGIVEWLDGPILIYITVAQWKHVCMHVGWKTKQTDLCMFACRCGGKQSKWECN